MTGDADARTRTVGTLGTVDGAGIVRIEDRYDTDAGDLWSAMTDPDRLARWYGKVEGDLHLGGQFGFYLEGPDIDGRGRVEACEPPRYLLVKTTETEESASRGGSRPVDQTMEVTLTPDGGQTVLVIEVRGLPLDKIAAYGVGWQLHAESLASYLAGHTPPAVEARWPALVGSYEKMAAELH